MKIKSKIKLHETTVELKNCILDVILINPYSSIEDSKFNNESIILYFNGLINYINFIKFLRHQMLLKFGRGKYKDFTITTRTIPDDPAEKSIVVKDRPASRRVITNLIREVRVIKLKDGKELKLTYELIPARSSKEKDYIKFSVSCLNDYGWIKAEPESGILIGTELKISDEWYNFLELDSVLDVLQAPVPNTGKLSYVKLRKIANLPKTDAEPNLCIPKCAHFIYNRLERLGIKHSTKYDCKLESEVDNMFYYIVMSVVADITRKNKPTP